MRPGDKTLAGLHNGRLRVYSDSSAFGQSPVQSQAQSTSSSTQCFRGSIPGFTIIGRDFRR